MFKLTLSPPVAWTTGMVPYLIAYSWFSPQGSNLDGINNMSQLFIRELKWVTENSLRLVNHEKSFNREIGILPGCDPMRNWNVKSNPTTELVSVSCLSNSHPALILRIPRPKHNLKQLGSVSFLIKSFYSDSKTW